MQPPSPSPALPSGPAPSRLPYMVAAAVAALPGVTLGLAMNRELGSGGLLNPDSAMRMARLQDIVQAKAPLHAVMRDGSGLGTVLHWSHLLDSLLLLLAAPFVPFLGRDAALHGAALLAGPLGLAGLGVALCFVAAAFAPRGSAWVEAAAAGTAPAVTPYGLVRVVHHHVLLAACVAMACGWALRLVLGRAGARGGLALGAWAGVGLWLSPETLPFSLMALGGVWVAWVCLPRGEPEGERGLGLGRGLAAAGLGFAVVCASAWLVDPPAAGWRAVEPDRISLPFVLLACGSAVAGLVAWLVRGRVAAVGCGVVLAGLWLVAFPQVLRGTEALMPRAVVEAMFGGIEEMAPVRGAWDAVEMLGGGVFAAVVSGLVAWRRRDLPSAYVVACAVGLVALGALHQRFATYGAVAGACLLPLVLRWISESRVAAGLQSLGRVGVALPLILGPMLLPAAAKAGAESGVSCSVAGAVELLRPHPGAVVLSGVNEVPELLYRTRVRTVGSLYHRNPDGFMRLRAAWRSVPGDAAVPGPEVVATGATLVLACPGAARSSLVEGLPHSTLLDRVNAGRPPRWLHRVAGAGPGGMVLYAVEP